MHYNLVILERIANLENEIENLKTDIKTSWQNRNNADVLHSIGERMHVWQSCAQLRVSRNKLDEICRRFPREAAKHLVT